MCASCEKFEYFCLAIARIVDVYNWQPKAAEKKNIKKNDTGVECELWLLWKVKTWIARRCVGMQNVSRLFLLSKAVKWQRKQRRNRNENKDKSAWYAIEDSELHSRLRSYQCSILVKLPNDLKSINSLKTIIHISVDQHYKFRAIVLRKAFKSLRLIN